MKATITLHGVEPKNIPALHELLDDPAINALLKSSQLDDGENYTVTIVLNGKNVSDPEPLKSFAPLLGVADPDPEAKTSKPSYEEILGAAVDELADVIVGEKLPYDIVFQETGEVLVPANRKITRTLIRKMLKSPGAVIVGANQKDPYVEEILEVFNRLHPLEG